MRVRDAEARDLGDIRRLFNALIPSTTVAWREEEASEDEMAAWFAQRERDGHPVLVAEDDAGVIGYCCWSSFRHFTGYRHTVEHTVHVDGLAQGAGVGRRLMEALIERARERGVHVMIGAIDADNTASLAFHRAIGFAEVGQLPQVGRKFDRWLDLVLVQQILG